MGDDNDNPESGQGESCPIDFGNANGANADGANADGANADGANAPASDPPNPCDSNAPPPRVEEPPEMDEVARRRSDLLNTEYLFYMGKLKELVEYENSSRLRMIAEWYKVMSHAFLGITPLKNKRNHYYYFLLVCLIIGRYEPILLEPPKEPINLLDFDTIEVPELKTFDWEKDDTLEFLSGSMNIEGIVYRKRKEPSKYVEDSDEWQDLIAQAEYGGFEEDKLPSEDPYVRGEFTGCEPIRDTACPYHERNDCFEHNKLLSSLGDVFDKQFRYLLYLVRPYVALLRQSAMRIRAAKWLRFLCRLPLYSCTDVKGNRNGHLILFSAYIMERSLVGPYGFCPPDKLYSLEELVNILPKKETMSVTDPSHPKAAEFLRDLPYVDEGAFAYLVITGDLSQSMS